MSEVEPRNTELLEKLAALEHEQWIEWSKTVEPDIDIVQGKGWDRLQRWRKCWKPYSELTEAQKDQDRIYAWKVLKIVGADAEKALTEQKQKLRETIEKEGMNLEEIYTDLLVPLLESKAKNVELYESWLPKKRVLNLIEELLKK